MFSVKNCTVTDVRQSGDDLQCFACRKGKLHKKPLVKCYLKHKYTKDLDEKEVYVCFVCLKRTFKQSDSSLMIAYRVYNKQKVRKDYPRVFELLEKMPGMTVHPTIATFWNYTQQGKTISPTCAAETMRILLIFHNDECLRENYLWLRNQQVTAHNDVEQMLQKHAGIYGVWPTIEEKRSVEARRSLAYSQI